MALGGELDGALVVSLEQAVAAPYCGLLLADAGARVIKVERPGGDFARAYDRGVDGNSVFFAWLNRGKESVCLDLDRADDANLLHAMLDRADVFLSNLAPGALEKRGFGQEALGRRNPGLVSCEITGYGNGGEAASKKAYDFLVQGETGLCAVTGTPAEPARVGISITDLSTGLTAYSAILRALIGRGRHGRGAAISVSMFDVLADWMNMPLLGHRYLGGAQARLGLTHALICPYGAFATGDGGQVLIAVQNDREWRALCTRVLERPDLADDPRFEGNAARLENREAAHAAVDAVFSGLPRAEIVGRLDAARIACAQLSSVADLAGHRFLRETRARFGDVDLAMADLPVQIEGERIRDVPFLDEHGARIRKEFGA